MWQLTSSADKSVICESDDWTDCAVCLDHLLEALGYDKQVWGLDDECIVGGITYSITLT